MLTINVDDIFEGVSYVIGNNGLDFAVDPEHEQKFLREFFLHNYW